MIAQVLRWCRRLVGYAEGGIASTTPPGSVPVVIPSKAAVFISGRDGAAHAIHLSIKLRESDGRWIAECEEIRWAMAYGATQEDAYLAACEVALRALAAQGGAAVRVYAFTCAGCGRGTDTAHKSSGKDYCQACYDKQQEEFGEDCADVARRED